MAQSLADLNLHLIFSTKHRLPTIDPAIRNRLHGYLAATCQTMKCHLIEAGGIPDHIHLLVSWSRDLSLSDGMRELKSSSSRWIHDTFPTMKEFGWQDGYAGFSVSRSQIEVVRKYIVNQEEHHRTRTFQEELRDFFKKHDVQFDERYLWN